MDDAVARIARAVLRRSLDIGYAGYLRGGGFTNTLADDSGTVVVGPRFVSFLGWPHYQKLTPTQIAETLGLCRYVKVESRHGEAAADNDEARASMEAVATTEARTALFSKRRNKDIDGGSVAPRIAQVLVGGKERGFLGIMPGIAEEAMIALKSGLAVFVVGAFGGAAGLLGDYLSGGKWPDVFTIDAHVQDSKFSRLLQPRSSCDPEAAFAELREVLGRASERDEFLNNGLSRDENKVLMTTSDLGMVVRLISKGLSTLS